MINTIAIANYRSLRNVVAALGPLNVVSGENGAGKSNLYRGLRLLADTAQGGVVASLAREGGLSSTLWAGPEKISRAMRRGEHPVQGGPRREPAHLRLGFATDELSYCIDLGLPETPPVGISPRSADQTRMYLGGHALSAIYVARRSTRACRERARRRRRVVDREQQYLQLRQHADAHCGSAARPGGAHSARDDSSVALL